jgi:hypothetical protein
MSNLEAAWLNGDQWESVEAVRAFPLDGWGSDYRKDRCLGDNPDRGRDSERKRRQDRRHDKGRSLKQAKPRAEMVSEHVQQSDAAHEHHRDQPKLAGRSETARRRRQQ